jgi:glucan endo-1,3-alpha-glucosidase
LSARIAASYNNWWKDVIDGLSYFAVGGLPADLIATGEAYADLMRAHGKIYLAGCSPYFWIGRFDPGYPKLLRRYFEYNGGEGIAAQWESIINIQKPDWVMLVTFNDFTESYMSPAHPSEMTEKAAWYNVGPLLKSHAGYAALMKYYIEWFKLGVRPAVSRDALYYFYRTHPKDLIAYGDIQNVVQYGEVLDRLYVTTNLTNRATLKITSGRVVSHYELSPGMQHTRIPFDTGVQIFDLIRNGSVIIHREGDPIDDVVSVYNFTPTTGFAYSK